MLTLFLEILLNGLHVVVVDGSKLEFTVGFLNDASVVSELDISIGLAAISFSS